MKWIESEGVKFEEKKKMTTEIPCLAHFVRDRDNLVTTDASRTGLGIILWQRENDNTIRRRAFTSRYFNDIDKFYSIEELELLAVVWGLEKFRFYLYGKTVYLYTDHQALEPSIKQNRSYRQYSEPLTRRLDRLLHFDA